MTIGYVMLTEEQVEEGHLEDRLLALDRTAVNSVILSHALDPQVCGHGDWHVWQIDEPLPESDEIRHLVPERIADWIVTPVAVDQGVHAIEWVTTAIATPTTRRARFVHGCSIAPHREETPPWT